MVISRGAAGAEQWCASVVHRMVSRRGALVSIGCRRGASSDGLRRVSSDGKEVYQGVYHVMDNGSKHTYQVMGKGEGKRDGQGVSSNAQRWWVSRRGASTAAQATSCMRPTPQHASPVRRSVTSAPPPPTLPIPKHPPTHACGRARKGGGGLHQQNLVEGRP